MPLTSFAVQDFQSYRDTQTLTIDPTLTRSRDGITSGSRRFSVPSAFVEDQQGAGDSFEMTYRWRVGVDMGCQTLEPSFEGSDLRRNRVYAPHTQWTEVRESPRGKATIPQFDSKQEPGANHAPATI
jgi:hypothetical protein